MTVILAVLVHHHRDDNSKTKKKPPEMSQVVKTEAKNGRQLITRHSEEIFFLGFCKREGLNEGADLRLTEGIFVTEITEKDVLLSGGELEGLKKGNELILFGAGDGRTVFVKIGGERGGSGKDDSELVNGNSFGEKGVFSFQLDAEKILKGKIVVKGVNIADGLSTGILVGGAVKLTADQGGKLIARTEINGLKTLTLTLGQRDHFAVIGNGIADAAGEHVKTGADKTVKLNTDGLIFHGTKILIQHKS